jgi:poly(A) polymerase
LREIARAKEITTDIISGKKSWSDLFVRQTFFTHDYKYYLSIISASTSKEASNLWSGFVSSKVRILVSKIELLQDAGEINSIALVQPFSKEFERVHRCKESDLEEVKKGNLEFQMKEIETETIDPGKDISHLVAADGAIDKAEMPSANGPATKVDPGSLQTIWTVTHYVGIELNPGERTLDISRPVDEWKAFIQEWPSYNEEVHSLRVTLTRR